MTEINKKQIIIRLGSGKRFTAWIDFSPSNYAGIAEIVGDAFPQFRRGRWGNYPHYTYSRMWSTGGGLSEAWEIFGDTVYVTDDFSTLRGDEIPLNTEGEVTPVSRQPLMREYANW
ncbi:MAG: hypothetical protein HGA48_03915 [Candidatus Yonathbacteria bacterium]|nr:hypothetical protein [Candidatus Yonathbacteria bacterium]